jgi:hypothetical protein
VPAIDLGEASGLDIHEGVLPPPNRGQLLVGEVQFGTLFRYATVAASARCGPFGDASEPGSDPARSR